MMDWLHTSGVDIIMWLQEKFKDYSSQMLVTTHLGDPRNAFLLYFPLAYFCKPSVGVQVLWVAAISEYVNAVLKWLLHGERPYWWVQETALYTDHRPHLDQFRLTCETGPGSPSGHAMVTAAVLHTMVAAFAKTNLTKLNHRTLVCGVLWAWFAVFMTAVALSRCFIAAHFPHQVAAGTVTGVLISMAVNAVPKDKLTLTHYVGGAVFVLCSSLGLYWLLSVSGMDPAWSIRFAQKWCARSDWVHLSTTPFNALVRDASALCGLGVGLYLTKSKERSKKRASSEVSQSATYALMGVTLSLLLTQSSEYLNLPQQPALLFYLLSAAKHAALPLLTVSVIPKVCRGLIANTESLPDDETGKKVS